MAELEQRWTAKMLAELSHERLFEVAALYVAIGIDWNFEEAEVRGAWLDGRGLCDELVRRSNGEQPWNT